MDEKSLTLYKRFAEMSLGAALFTLPIIFPINTYVGRLYLPNIILFFSIAMIPVTGFILAILCIVKCRKVVNAKSIKGLAIITLVLLLFLSPLLIIMSNSRINLYRKSHVIEIPDVTTETSSLLSKAGENDHGVVCVTGYIEGSAEISLVDEYGTPITMHVILGFIGKEIAIEKRVCVEFATEIYGSECSLKYVPNEVTSGQLNIRYNVYPMKY